MSTYVINNCQDVENQDDLIRDNFHRYLSQNKHKKLSTQCSSSYIVKNQTKKLKRTKTNGLSESESLKSSN